ncbi:hypothetical protein J6590_087683 [Homalodisca vitripennis]|nr:hypothetical protein J6590_087683 [Homalodisca vitripennis]
MKLKRRFTLSHWCRGKRTVGNSLVNASHRRRFSLSHGCCGLRTVGVREKAVLSQPRVSRDEDCRSQGSLVKASQKRLSHGCCGMRTVGVREKAQPRVSRDEDCRSQGSLGEPEKAVNSQPRVSEEIKNISEI